MKKVLFSLLVAMCMMGSFTSCDLLKRGVKPTAVEQKDAKHEFRGAWIQTAFQDRYMNKSPQKCQEYLANLVEVLHQTGFNAIIFQIRPEGDAFYESNFEPWSRFLTGRQGKAPATKWDPMQFLIQECHQRGMEFHAWINPYRICASKQWNLSNDNHYYKAPDWYVTFDGRLYLNPGLPESRAFIREVVKDIVRRYDIDALHLDDYFYPYPVAGQTFDDGYAFSAYASQMGFDTTKPGDLANFRRRSVDILMKSLSQDIKSLKPWVRFGVSPFGIYRNKKSWSEGSDTNGTQCYDDLYADVLRWAEAGWVDYVIPQLYWEIGHKAADYKTLCDWWAKHIPSNCHLYIGQSIERSLDQGADGNNIADLTRSSNHFISKINQARQNKHIKGNCFWYAYEVEDNTFHVRDFLKQSVFTTRTMAPAYTNLQKTAPARVQGLNGVVENTRNGRALHLTWQAPRVKVGEQLSVRTYHIYRFAKGEAVDTQSLDHLYATTVAPEFFDYDIAHADRYTYVVAAVDYYNNEGKMTKKTFKL